MKRTFAVIFLLFFVTGVAFATTKKTTAKSAPQKFVIAGWVPYWKKSDGVQDLAYHIGKLDMVSPFSFEVKPNGAVVDKLKVNETPWPELFTAVRVNGGKIVPTIAWFRGEEIHSVLSSSTLRKSHEASVLSAMDAGGFNGIEIDYENKKAETKDYFSKFIKELAAEVHKRKKILSCTVEPRTPAADKFKVVPKILEYANDYKVLGAYCDEVRVMAYDQGTIDLKLNKAKGKTTPYVPVADPAWVEKVIKETLKSVSAKKIFLGVPTYGYEYQITNTGPYAYTRLRAINFLDAQALAISKQLVPVRNRAGELSFSYTSTTPRIVWFPDSRSVEGKIKLAKKYKLGGVAVFKIDGGTDPLMWGVLE